MNIKFCWKIKNHVNQRRKFQFEEKYGAGEACRAMQQLINTSTQQLFFISVGHQHICFICRNSLSISYLFSFFDRNNVEGGVDTSSNNSLERRSEERVYNVFVVSFV